MQFLFSCTCELQNSKSNLAIELISCDVTLHEVVERPAQTVADVIVLSRRLVAGLELNHSPQQSSGSHGLGKSKLDEVTSCFNKRNLNWISLIFSNIVSAHTPS